MIIYNKDVECVFRDEKINLFNDISLPYAIHPFIINKDKNIEYESRNIKLPRNIRANRFGYNDSYCVMNVPENQQNLRYMIYRIYLGRSITYYRDINKKAPNKTIQDFDFPGLHYCYRKTKETFSRTNWLYLDVDNTDKDKETTDLYDFVKNNKQYTMIYTTNNHCENHHKFRVFYLLNKSVNTEDKIKAIFNSLSKDINCDSQCFTVDKGFFGNTNADFYVADELRLINTDDYEIPPQSKNKIKQVKLMDDGNIELRPINKKVFKVFKNSCYVFNNLANREIVNHDEWFTIVNNLAKFEGVKIDTIKQISGRWEDLNKFFETWNYQSTKNPGYIQCNCRYKDKCSIFKFNPNISSIYQFLTSNTKIINPKYISSIKNIDIQFQDVDTVYKLINDTYVDIVKNKPGGKIYVIHAETGIGKTHILKTHRFPGLYCFKTHRLSDEFELGESYPIIDENFPLYDEIKFCYDNGISTTPVITEVFIKYPDDPFVIHYQNCINRFKSSDISKITHSRLIKSGNIFNIINHDTIIIDEDILTNMIDVGSINLKYLFNMIRVLPKSISKEFNEEMLAHPFPVGCNENIIKDTVKHNLRNFIRGKSKSKESYTGLLKFVESTHYTYDPYIDGLYHAKSMIPEIKKMINLGKKIIVLSATPNTEFYKMIFNDKVEMFTFPKAKDTGTCTIFKSENVSLYKSALNKVDDISLKKVIGNLCKHFGIPPTNIISYKSLQKKGINIFTHFFNTEGVNTISGQNLLVFGTPLLPLKCCFVIANAIGYRIKDFCIDKNPISGDGYIYIDYTFDNNILRGFQSYFTESELIQAIGRARILRNNCNVIVVTDIPIGNKYWDIYPIKLEFQNVTD